MNVTESEQFARRAATRITDELSRAGLAEKLREAAALFTGAKTGLDAAAADRGLCVDSGVESMLTYLADIATEVAGKLAAGEVFMTCAERDDLTADRLARADDSERNAMGRVTRGQLDQFAAEAYTAGFVHRKAVLT